MNLTILGDKYLGPENPTDIGELVDTTMPMNTQSLQMILEVRYYPDVNRCQGNIFLF